MSNREIKFRGKRLDSGEWIYGDLVKLSVIDPFTYIAKGVGYKVGDPEIGKPIKVYPDSVGQYTGLKDKNGKEIYEGDIVRNRYPELFYVRWDEDNATFTWAWYRKNHEGNIFQSAGSETKNWQRRIESCEVIGNIYENPELLK